jgi:acyl dehydratase
MRFFDDIDVGEVSRFGAYEVTEEEIISFGEQYDPQPFHLDREAAADSLWGGLIASGWHTAAATMRMVVEGFLDDVAAVGGKGADELRWRRPVRPGQTLAVRATVVAKELEREERGLVSVRVETLDAETEDVAMRMVSKVMVAVEGTDAEAVARAASRAGDD